MKCKQSNDVSTLAQKYSPAFKKTTANWERVMHESYIKLISLVAVYSIKSMIIYAMVILALKAITGDFSTKSHNNMIELNRNFKYKF